MKPYKILMFQIKMHKALMLGVTESISVRVLAILREIRGAKILTEC